MGRGNLQWLNYSTRGSGPVWALGLKEYTLHFLAGCRERRLNQTLFVLSLSLGFIECVCYAVN